MGFWEIKAANSSRSSSLSRLPAFREKTGVSITVNTDHEYGNAVLRTTDFVYKNCETQSWAPHTGHTRVGTVRQTAHVGAISKCLRPNTWTDLLTYRLEQSRFQLLGRAQVQFSGRLSTTSIPTYILPVAEQQDCQMNVTTSNRMI